MRSSNKRLFPLCLDASVGGHVAQGENYYQAFCRESLEELNIDIKMHKHEFVAELKGRKDKVSAFMHVYIIYTDATPIYNKNDFISADWYSMESLKNKINSGHQAKGDLIELIEILERFIYD